MSKLNAEEVRNLMPKSTEKIIEEITQACAERAKLGFTDYTTNNYDFGSTLEPTPKQRNILQGLHDLGFKAEQVDMSRLFVDIYLKVSWCEEEEEEGADCKWKIYLEEKT